MHFAKTAAVEKTLRPVFDASFTVFGVDPCSTITLTLGDLDKEGRDDCLGQVSIPLDCLRKPDVLVTKLDPVLQPKPRIRRTISAQRRKYLSERDEFEPVPKYLLFVSGIVFVSNDFLFDTPCYLNRVHASTTGRRCARAC